MNFPWIQKLVTAILWAAAHKKRVIRIHFNDGYKKKKKNCKRLSILFLNTMRLVNYPSITQQDMNCSNEELVWINDVFYIQIDRKDKKGNWYWHTTFKIKDPRLPLKNICACIFAAMLFWALKGTFFSSTRDVILKILIWVVKKNRARTDQMKITVLLEKILLAFISEGIY